MRILITGGAGFIGSHLAERLIPRKDEVQIIDGHSTGSIENIDQIKNHANFRCHIYTVRNHRLTAELIDKCYIIYHLAAAVGVRLIVESPVNTIETNTRGTDVV